MAAIKIQTAFRSYRDRMIREAISRTDVMIDRIAQPEKVIEQIIKHHHHHRRRRMTQKTESESSSDYSV